MLHTLTKLVATNLNVERWVFKIDDEYGSRGVAYLDVSSIKPISDFKKLGVEITEEVTQRIHEYLQSTFQHKLNIIVPKVYKGFGEFIRHFTQNGGIIEAQPIAEINKQNSVQVSFCIEPNGQVVLVGSYDKFFS